MLYVVVEELVPEASEGEHSNIGTIGFAIGFALMMVLDVALDKILSFYDYDGAIVEEYCSKIVEKYIDLFYEFESTMKKLIAKIDF